MYLIGTGFDAHRLVKGRNLILGGVNIPFEKGLLGYSDADVLTHSIIDAVLGAMGKGDIGQHFPDTDPLYKNISSLKLLKKTADMMQKNGFKINNLDSIIIAQEPKLISHILKMKKNLAKVLKIKSNLINIKATTTEKMGFTGRGAGIAAQSIVLLHK